MVMLNKKIFLTIFFVQLTLFCTGCSDESPSPFYIEKPEEYFPCWEQDGSCGKWNPIDEQIPEDSCQVVLTVGDRKLGKSLCEKCQSIRIIDLEGKRWRILESDYFESMKPCEHRWFRGTNSQSVEPIQKEDLLVLYYKHELYLVQITDYNEDGDFRYKIAQVRKDQVSEEGRLFLETSDWKNKKGQKHQYMDVFHVLKFSDTQVVTNVFIRLPDWTYYFRIWYPYSYGGPYNPEDELSDIAHIAIIRKADLENSKTIYLKQYRFKTWEDGLGNVCENK